MSKCNKFETALPILLTGLLFAGQAFAEVGGINSPKSLFCQIYDAMKLISPVLALIFFSFAGWRYFVQGARLEMLVAPIGGGIICSAAPWFVETLFNTSNAC